MTARRQERGRKAYLRGLAAERMAAWALRLKGYGILAQRYRTPVGEIDLIARKGRVLAFVEVKSRDNLPDGLEAVTSQAQARLSRAAEHFAVSRPDMADTDWRFDVMVVTGLSWPKHVRGAF